MFSTVLNIFDNYKIQGESILKGYENWIDLTAISHQIILPMTIDKSSNSRTAGRPKLEDFQVKMLLNKAYPKLLEACADGKNLGTITIKSLRVNEGELSEMVTFELGNVYIADVVMQGGAQSAGGSHASQSASNDLSHSVVSVRFNYENIVTTYAYLDNTGKSGGSIASKKINATVS